MNSRNAATHLQDAWNVWGTQRFCSAIGHAQTQDILCIFTRECRTRTLSIQKIPCSPSPHRSIVCWAGASRGSHQLRLPPPILPLACPRTLNSESPKTCNSGEALVKNRQSSLSQQLLLRILLNLVHISVG